MDFDYNKIFAGKTYTKNGIVKNYKSTKAILKNYKTIVDWVKDIDCSDAGVVLARISQYPTWLSQKTRGDKMNELSTVIRNLDETDVQKLGINPNNRDDVLKAYSIASWNEVSNAPSTKARLHKKKTRQEEDVWWDADKHTEFVEDRVEQARDLVKKGLNNLSDSEKDELQQCILVIWYKYMPNIRALQHTLKKREYNDHCNFVIKHGQSNDPRYFITYNDHKMCDIQGPVCHIVNGVNKSVVQGFMETLFELYPLSSYLFNNFDKRRPFTDAEFYRYIVKAHGDFLGARILRVMDHSDLWKGVPSLNEVLNDIAERGHLSIGRSMSYARN